LGLRKFILVVSILFYGLLFQILGYCLYPCKEHGYQRENQCRSIFNYFPCTKGQLFIHILNRQTCCLFLETHFLNIHPRYNIVVVIIFILRIDLFKMSLYFPYLDLDLTNEMSFVKIRRN